nr:hypothetical protein [Turicibacter sp.]
MKCLVCHQLIVIKRFQELFALKSPLLCCHCGQYFIQKKGPCLFEKNDWIMEVIHRLEKGDLILLQLLIPSYYQ